MTQYAIVETYHDQIELLRSMGDDELLYQWLIDQGRSLQKKPLPEAKRTEENRVSRCQYQLFVDLDDDVFKAWSDGLIASGYAFVLIDIFNQLTPEEASSIKPEAIFDRLDIGSILSLNRSNGFYQMIGMLINKKNSA